ncbi:ROK family transcriptional regulator [Paenibacillus silviterrae]|uniref:ROK family transcriptional regulator n=1 Tax=Paenibacillus silviterrae TaxID=3242194 RepID=UPI0025433A13|nr:ROK family transcriptional regulator [Paenibacillus chinjuensis]
MAGNEISDKKGSKLSILQTLRKHGNVSRIDLTRLTGLSRATVSVSIAELIESKLVRETTDRMTTKGRPATYLELVPYAGTIIGADYDNSRWTLCAFDLSGNIIKTASIPAALPSAEDVLHSLLIQLKPFIGSLEQPPIPILGLGVPGLVDSDYQTIRSAPELGWYHIDVGGIVRKELGWTSVTINRHRARGLAECRYGSGQDYHHQIYLGVGSGIAAGIYIDRQLMSGSTGGAGELGHTTILPDGPLCHCGNHGCLQVLSSAPTIEQQFRKRIRQGEASVLQNKEDFDLQMMRAENIGTAADQGDELSGAIIKQAASYLGIAMANLVNLFNPEAIILGGRMPHASKLFVDTAASVMRQRASSSLGAVTAVKVNALHDIGGPLGAANFAFDQKAHISLFQ